MFAGLAILALTGPACLKNVLEDPAYIAAKKQADADREKLAAAIIRLEAAKTDADRETAADEVVKATALLELSTKKLEEIQEGAINSAVGGILGTGSNLPGYAGIVGSVLFGVYSVIVRLSRGNYRGAVRELATRIEDLRKTPEGVAAVEAIKKKLAGTSTGKALDGVLTELGILKKSSA